MQWSVEEYFKVHSTDYRKPLEILHWKALVHMKKLLEWPMYANLSLESDKHVIARKTLKRLTKLIDRLHSIGLEYDEGMESRTVMVPANGMVYKLREELKNDDALLFGLIFLAYLDIGGEYFCLLHLLFAFMYTSYQRCAPMARGLNSNGRFNGTGTAVAPVPVVASSGSRCSCR